MAGFDTSAIVFTAMENLLLGGYLMQNYTFILLGLVDFQRRNYMISMCGVLLNPDKLSYPIKY
jgi:hypothetical protein